MGILRKISKVSSLIALLALTGIILTGCGAEKVPDENQMKLDVVNNGINVFWLNNQEEVLEVSSLTLEKRKTDKEEGLDDAYVSITFENENYTVTADCVLSYSLYDEGGWILDWCEFTDYASTATKPLYSEDEFITLLCEHFDMGYVQNREHGINADGNYYDLIHFSGTKYYSYMTATVTGYCSMVFCDDLWFHEIVFENMNTDWSSLLGEWEHVESSWYYGTELVSVNISNIEQLSYEDMSVTYTSTATSWTAYDDDDAPNVFTTEEKTAIRDIKYSTELIWGTEVSVPQYSSVAIPLGEPFLGDQDYATIYLDRDSGAYSTEDKFEYYTTEFIKK